MPLTVVSGDPTLTLAQTLVFGHNTRGRTEVGPLETRLFDYYPAAFATYRKQCTSERIKPGTVWVWRESKPFLAFMAVRISSVSSSRSRYVESAFMTLARDYLLYGLSSMAIAPLAGQEEWSALIPLADYWLRPCPLPITLYERYLPGIAAEG